MDDKLKYEIISKVQQDIEARDIAEELDVSYPTVLRVRNQYKEAVLNGTVDKLVDIDKLMVQDLAEKYPIDKVEALAKSVDGLDMLNTELQASALQITQRVKNVVVNTESSGELSDLTEIICKLQTAFFNKNSTQVNVQNNNYGDSSNDNPYNSYLADAPGSVNN